MLEVKALQHRRRCGDAAEPVVSLSSPKERVAAGRVAMIFGSRTFILTRTDATVSSDQPSKIS